MTFCIHCGAPGAGSSFCTSCGRKLPEAPLAAPAPPPPPQPSVAQPAPTGPTPLDRMRAWWRRRSTQVLARTALVLALIGTGLMVGWAVGADRNLVKAEPRPELFAAPKAEKGLRVMPDLRGLREEEALQILADLGLGQGAITVSPQPAAGELGVVLTQAPAHGFDIAGKVTLAVSSPARVPAFAGRDAARVLTELDVLGAQVETISRYVPGARVGSITEIDPGPGKPLPERVKVVIAADPVEVDATLLEAVVSGCYTDDDTLNGRTFTTLLTCSTIRGETTDQTYVLRRTGTLLKGTLGVPDNSTTSGGVRLVVVADGAVIGDFSATYGTTEDFAVDVSGALRVTLRLSTSSPDGVYAGVGDLVIEGDADAMQPLVDETSS